MASRTLASSSSCSSLAEGGSVQVGGDAGRGTLEPRRVQRHLLPRASGTQMVQTHVHRDAVDPGREFRRRFVLSRRPMHTDEDLLHHVLALCPVAQVSTGEVEDDALVPADESRERRATAGAEIEHQLGVNVPHGCSLSTASRRSCPQAASTPVPRVRRAVTRTPRFLRIPRKAVTIAADGAENPVPDTSL